MNIQQLRYLLALADNETMTAAAGALGVSQPVMSRALKELEDELRTTILTRAGRRLLFTKDGQAILAAARRAITAFDEVSRSAIAMRNDLSLRIATSHPTSVQLTPLLESLLRRLPQLHVRTTHTQGTDEMLQLLREGSVDVCFGSAIKPGAGVAFTPHEDLEVVLLSPDGCALPRALKLTDLDKVPLICLPPSKERARLIENDCVKAQFRPHYVLESDDPSMFLDAVRRGIGSCLAWRGVGESTHGVEVRGFAPPRMIPVGFYHARKPAVQVRTLLSLARQMRRRDLSASGAASESNALQKPLRTHELRTVPRRAHQHISPRN